jgi:hypothetical protein
MTEIISGHPVIGESGNRDSAEFSLGVQARLRERLRAPLPKEAIKAHPTKSWMSSINGAFIVERLNDCFGEEGWMARYEIVENSPSQKMVVVKAIFEADVSKGQQIYGKIYREAFGGNDNTDRGDAYKGACTDALGKIASQLGIAGEVYKGMLDEMQAPVSSSREKSKKGDTRKYEPVGGVVTELRNIAPQTVYLQVNSNGLWIRTMQMEHADKLRNSLGCRVELTAFWDKGKAKKDDAESTLMTVTAVHGVFNPVPRTEYVRQQNAADGPRLGIARDDDDPHMSPDMVEAFTEDKKRSATR